MPLTEAITHILRRSSHDIQVVRAPQKDALPDPTDDPFGYIWNLVPGKQGIVRVGEHSVYITKGEYEHMPKAMGVYFFNRKDEGHIRKWDRHWVDAYLLDQGGVKPPGRSGNRREKNVIGGRHYPDGIRSYSEPAYQEGRRAHAVAIAMHIQERLAA